MIYYDRLTRLYRYATMAESKDLGCQMNAYIEYLSGYTIAGMLALSSAISVASFMANSTLLPIAAIFTASCFILNLILFWQEFENILKLSENLTYSNAVPIFLTGCSSIIMYAFTVFSFFELGKTSYIVFLLFPTPLIHFISLCCSIGFFGLYIGDFIKMKQDGFNAFPLSEFLLGSLLTAVLISNPMYPICTFLLGSLLMYLSFDENTRLDKLCRIIAITASMVLSINGMGASLPTLYQFAETPIAISILKALSYIGLASLTICDAVFSRNAMNYILKNPPSYKSIPEYIALGLALCNAMANSQITADGKGYFNLDAWLGGAMSFIVMSNSTQKIAKETDIQLPLSSNANMAWALFFYNSTIYLTFSTWLFIYRPKAYKALSQLFSKPILARTTTPGSIAKASFLLGHVYLWSKMPNEEDSLTCQGTQTKIEV